MLANANLGGIMLSLDIIDVGKTVKVKKIHCSKVLKSRIMDMGITNGTELVIQKSAPLGDPLQVNVRGYNLSLRKADAKLIEIEEIAL